MGQSKIDRTNEFETAVKTAIVDDMVRKEIQEINFHKLVRQGIIVEDMGHIFDPMNGINWITA